MVYIIAETEKFMPSNSMYMTSNKRDPTMIREYNGRELREEATSLERRKETSGVVEICLGVQMA